MSPKLILKNIYTLLKGNLLGHFVVVLGSVILPKFYGEDSYGAFGIYISLIGFFSIINQLELKNTLIISKSLKTCHEKYNAIIGLSFILTGVCILISILIFSFDLINFNEFKILMLAVFTAFFVSFNRLNEALLNFKKNYKRISKFVILKALSNQLLKLCFLPFKKLNGLIYGNLTSVIFIAGLHYRKHRNFLKYTSFKEIWDLLKKHRNFINYYFTSSLINSTAVHLSPLILLLYFDISYYSNYFLGITILGLPLQLITNSVAPVYFKNTANYLENSPSKIYKLTRYTVLFTSLAMFLVVIILNTFGIEVLEFFYKEDYQFLRTCILYCSVLFLGKAAFTPIRELIVTLNKNQLIFFFNLYLIVINLGSVILFGAIYQDFFQYLLISSVLGGLGYLFMVFYSLHEIQKFGLKNGIQVKK